MLLAFVAFVAFVAPARLAAQAARIVVGGQAVRVIGRDTVPLAGARVVLHRLSAGAQGPVDSVRAGADGRFRFRIRFRIAGDSLALILGSTRYSGIEYFSRPVRVGPTRPDTALLIVAADTSSRAPLSLAARYLVVSRPVGGRRGVLDLIVLQNRGATTRVAPDTTRPSWSMSLPHGLTNFEVGDGDISPAAVGLSGDMLTISSPVSPGERQLVVTYAMPADARVISVPLDIGADSVVVLLEEDGARVTSAAFAQAEAQVIEAKAYRRWIATKVAPGEVTIRVPSVGTRGKWIPPAFAAALGVLLVGATAWLLRRRMPTVQVRALSADPDPAALMEVLAQLDARYAGREATVGAAQWSEYVRRREALREALDRALAARGTRG